MVMRNGSQSISGAVSAGRVIEQTPLGKAERELVKLRQEIRFELVILDAEMAGSLLERNTKNRALRPPIVARMARDWRAGKWQFNAEPICVSNTGILLQGQHRCAMVLETGVPIVVLLVSGLPESVFTTYDTGLRRSAADVLHVLGHVNCTALGSALGWIDRYRSDAMGDNRRGGVRPYSVQELLDEHSRLIESVRLASVNRTKKGCGVQPSLLAACHYLFSLVDKDAADKFVADLRDGVGLQATDAVYLLRERMNRQKESKAKLPPHEVAALVVKAWNFRRRGAACKALRWRTGGDAAEAFPKIEGLE